MILTFRQFSIPLIWSLCLFFSCGTNVQQFQSDVLVIGGGASGTAAGIQSARDGSKTILIEPTPWLGGMLTASGVGATDGNHRLPSGLWGEFREKLYAYYGGPDSVYTGWVSNTLFEPHIGNRMWNELTKKETNLTVIHGYHVVEVLKEGKKVAGAIFEDDAKNRIRITASITIDATELGDALALAGAAFVTGQDTDEDPHNANIQDLTYCAVLKDYGESREHLLSEPSDYDPTEFDCICREVCPDASRKVPDCQAVLNYGKMPNGKYMINWPNNGNDYYLNPIPLTYDERKKAYQDAKNRSLGLVYFLQTQAGFPNLGLADDEFQTDDLLPFIPYHREARRIAGQFTLTEADLIRPNPRFVQDAIAVGDYPLDHHHDKNTETTPEQYPPIPSFSIPYGCLVPNEIEGLLVAEKSISVTHQVNGATRLQPCVILIGQAAGAAAAICSEKIISTHSLPVSLLQQRLLDANCWLLPFIDIQPKDSFFKPLQKAGVLGIFEGHGVPYKWANQTWIYPDSTVSKEEYEKAVAVILASQPSGEFVPTPDYDSEKKLTRKELAQILYEKTSASFQK